MKKPYIADDGTYVHSLEELQAKNQFFKIMDGAEVQGSIYDMIGNVDVEKLRSLTIPQGLEGKIGFYKDNASAVTVYCDRPRGFVGSRTIGEHVYIRGLNEEGKLLKDGQHYISFWISNLDLPIEREGTEIHSKVRKQIVALVLGSKVTEQIGKPYRRSYENAPWDYQTMSPSRLVDLSLSDEEVVSQLIDALYAREER